MPPNQHLLSNSIAATGDAQLAQIVALVDALPVRGEADALIAPVRARLQQLRPPRPLRLGRVLFTPLDPVIVPIPRWRPGMAALPRPALVPLQAMVREGLGPRAPEMEQVLAAGGPAARRVARELWRAASGILLDPKPALPSAWGDAGLTADVFAPLCRAVGLLLEPAEQIEDWAEAPDLPDELRLQSVIGRSLAGGSTAATMQIAVLLGKLPQAATAILRAAAGAGRDDPRLAASCQERGQDLALDHLCASARDEVARAPLPEAIREIRRAAALVEGLGRQAGPLRRQALDAARRDLDAQCRARFADALGADLLAAAGSLTADLAMETVPRLEAAARDLRQFAQAGAQMAEGAAPYYETALRQGAVRLGASGAAGAMTVIDRVRLIEILAGPEAALRYLGAARTG